MKSILDCRLFTLRFVIGKEHYLVKSASRDRFGGYCFINNLEYSAINESRFTLAVLKKDFDVEMAKEVFPQLAHIITTLGFMDEMIEFIVQYNKKGGDEDVEP